jgi:hypothetical protein
VKDTSATLIIVPEGFTEFANCGNSLGLLKEFEKEISLGVPAEFVTSTTRVSRMKVLDAGKVTAAAKSFHPPPSGC